MIEAMLCGVPVLATACGSVPEIIDDGITGVICDDPIEMVGAARIAGKLFDRERIRAIALERWSSSRMAEDYLRLYNAAAMERALVEEVAEELPQDSAAGA